MCQAPNRAEIQEHSKCKARQAWHIVPMFRAPRDPIDVRVGLRDSIICQEAEPLAVALIVNG